MSDAVNHPKHYNDHPSGVECITVVEHMPFNGRPPGWTSRRLTASSMPRTP